MLRIKTIQVEMLRIFVAKLFDLNDWMFYPKMLNIIDHVKLI